MFRNYVTTSLQKLIKFSSGSTGVGRLFCTLIKGSLNPRIEDSLGRRLRYFTSLRLNETLTDSTFSFVFPGAERSNANDEVYINTAADQLKISRNQSMVYEDKVSNLLEGRMTENFK